MGSDIHINFIVLPHWEVLKDCTVICYPTQPYYPDIEPTSPCLILFIIMLSAWLASEKNQVHVIGLTRPGFEPVGQNPMIFQNEKLALNSFRHRIRPQGVSLLHQVTALDITSIPMID